jgi:hypothetical protein
LLRDGENHHESGVHDANGNPGGPYSRVGDVSLVVGKVSETLRSFGLNNTARWCSGRHKCRRLGTVRQLAAEERFDHGLAALPDGLAARYGPSW